MEKYVTRSKPSTPQMKQLKGDEYISEPSGHTFVYNNETRHRIVQERYDNLQVLNRAKSQDATPNKKQAKYKSSLGQNSKQSNRRENSTPQSTESRAVQEVYKKNSNDYSFGNDDNSTSVGNGCNIEISQKTPRFPGDSNYKLVSTNRIYGNIGSKVKWPLEQTLPKIYNKNSYDNYSVAPDEILQKISKVPKKSKGSCFRK